MLNTFYYEVSMTMYNFNKNYILKKCICKLLYDSEKGFLYIKNPSKINTLAIQ